MCTLTCRATEGNRTLDLTFTKRLLYQLSYGGTANSIPVTFPYHHDCKGPLLM
jgi:hypothetical protein